MSNPSKSLLMSSFSYKVNARALEGDLCTPVGTYLKVRDLFAQSALMESSDYHGGENNRSFIALDPLASVSIAHGVAIESLPDGSRTETPLTATFGVAEAIDGFIRRFKVEGEYSGYCGLYGYMGFNAIRYFENIEVKDSTAEQNDAPDIHYILYRYVLVFNDFKNELVLLELTADGEESGMERIVNALRTGQAATYGFHAVGDVSSPLTDEEHKANIRKGIAHCLRGDVFQIVLSRRFVQRYTGDDFQLYRALRRINPSPYLFYFDFGGFRIFGSSPETHCRLEKDTA